ncbi:CRISPR-associated endonuclease Cas1 [Mucilaginibacter psychrotolerans]|uniref:hypothetical protein n=1 Tax=Mucilaginibacter psychrotolerans TaxID=1524096 RepID=UPI001864408E|nr:hypothetical protein [Mucilaginibacter psychrotolerans]
MIKRTLHFSNPAYLSLKEGQLLIDLPQLKVLGEMESKKSVPIEDTGIVVLNHQQITITHGCIAALLYNNSAIITCNHTRHITGMMLPIDGHHTISALLLYGESVVSNITCSKNESKSQHLHGLLFCGDTMCS